jgi:hypothetical protein
MLLREATMEKLGYKHDIDSLIRALNPKPRYASRAPWLFYSSNLLLFICTVLFFLILFSRYTLLSPVLRYCSFIHSFMHSLLLLIYFHTSVTPSIDIRYFLET